jgi:3-dehydroquinate dehydratase/shikimate dehydrogenase
MNNGQICVPVTGATADEMIENIRRAAVFADVIELRIDSLDPGEIDPLFVKLKRERRGPEKPFLVTFRAREQGGYRDLTLRERQEFWAKGNNDFWGGDLEEDVIEETGVWREENVIICSYHDFDGVPDRLESVYERLKGVRNYTSLASIIKLAVQPADITDSLPLWNLLKRAREEDVKFIPVAMGEAGKWTRIMGPAFGAPLTYGSLDTGKETAPGQITAKDLIDIYRVKELTEKTRVFGVIGDPVSKSLSPYMHNPAFRSKGIDAVFMHLEVKDLKRFITEFIPGSRLNFGGLSVTMPHKQAIVPFLDGIDDAARAIGAVNTVKVEDGKLYGYNTDAHGFIVPLKKAYGELTGAKAALLGAGGAARACAYALKKEGAGVTVFVRDVGKAAGFAGDLGVDLLDLAELDTAGFDIVINATPVGMRAGEEDRTLLDAERLKDVKLVFDLITKPAETALMREAEKAGVPVVGGVEMLIAQGIKQFEIWTGQEAPADIMRGKVIERLLLP